jgi:peptidoglycan hydrolase-like protein with peptidoglycan-binding domain
VQQTVTTLRLDKWKRGTVRDETGENINAILRDLQVTLPPLLGAADAAQGTVSNVLPVSRNINSLYDVLLRVVEAARVSAPADEIVQLQQALINLGGARRILDDRLQEAVAAQEKQIVELSGTLRAQAASKCPAPPATPVCATPTPPRKAKKKPATPAKPAQPPTSPAPTTPKS